jgi:dihydroorotase
VSQPDLVVRSAVLATDENKSVDLLVAKGRVAALVAAGSRPVPADVKSVDAKGLLLLPGLTDVHTHLREPGQEWKETIATGLAAAAKGGFVNVMCMANTDPVNDQGAVTEMMLDRALRAHPRGPRLYPVGALTVGLDGKALAPMEELKLAGCKAFSNDGRPIADAEIFRRALEYASDLGVPVIDHCEDPGLAPHAGINEGAVSARLGLRGAPTAGEAIQVARDCLLAQYLGVRIHIAHVSCAQSVDVIRHYKAKGAPVTAETCPHYLILTEDACENYNTAAKTNPPLRTREDQLALLAALEDGTIDVLCTDHAPHATHEKETPFDEAANGISGFETALSATWELVARGELSVKALLSAWCERPGAIFNLPVNRFAEGDPADFILFDASARWTVTPGALLSKGKNTPLMGRELTGVVRAAYVGGKNVL